MPEHEPTQAPTTLQAAQGLGHEVLPAQANHPARQQGESIAVAQPKPGDLCHIGLCDPNLHTRINFYLDDNLQCNVAVKAPC